MSDAKVKLSQQVLFFITTSLMIGSTFLLVSQFSKNEILVFFVFLIETTSLNYLAGKLYEVKIENKSLHFENMWRKKVYPTKDLMEIRLVKFIIPFPFNPYLKFIFKDNKGITIKLKSPLRIYLSSGGIEKHINYIISSFLG